MQPVLSCSVRDVRRSQRVDASHIEAGLDCRTVWVADDRIHATIVTHVALYLRAATRGTIELALHPLLNEAKEPLMSFVHVAGRANLWAVQAVHAVHEVA